MSCVSIFAGKHEHWDGGDDDGDDDDDDDNDDGDGDGDDDDDYGDALITD